MMEMLGEGGEGGDVGSDSSLIASKNPTHFTIIQRSYCFKPCDEMTRKMGDWGRMH